MSKAIDHTGQVFGRLTVIAFTGKDYWGYRIYQCQCRCGNSLKILSKKLTMKNGTISCNGCYDKIKYPKEYHTWADMRARCYTTTNSEYKNYGGRGIVVCEKWNEDFLNFIEDIGKAPSEEYTIERVDVNGNYEKTNCEWTTRDQQAKNKRNSSDLSKTLYNMTRKENASSK